MASACPEAGKQECAKRRKKEKEKNHHADMLNSSKQPFVDPGMFRYPPPPHSWDFAQFLQYDRKEFFWGLPSSPRPKIRIFTLVFTIVFLVLLAMSRITG